MTWPSATSPEPRGTATTAAPPPGSLCRVTPSCSPTRAGAPAPSRSSPTLERSHMVWAWSHAEGGAPFYEVPEVPEFADPEWLPIEVRAFEIRICAQDMAENNVDFAHFRYVHGSDAIPEDEFVT